MKKSTYQNAGLWAKFGRRLSQVDSTNAELQRELVRTRARQEVLPQGYHISADYQTAGRGRHGRLWEASPGQNLAVSYLLDDAGLGPSRLFTLSQNISLVNRQLVEDLTQREDVTVKWPNDIYVGDQKIAGILIETTLSGNSIAAVIVGIGINVNQLTFDHAPQATSLSLINGRMLSVADVLSLLTKRLEAAHHRLATLVARTDLYEINRQYHASLYGFMQRRKFAAASPEAHFTARVMGVTAEGQLRLDVAGDEHLYDLGSIRWL